MNKLLSKLPTRFASFALAFVVGSCASLVWRALPALRRQPAAERVAVLTRASVESPMWPERAETAAGHYWIFRRSVHVPQPGIERPVAVNLTDENLLSFGCVTLTVSVDKTRRLTLNGDAAGSLDDPAALHTRLASIYREREENRAYRSGMEQRADISAGERIDRTVILDAPASLGYGEILELVNSLERAGAKPVILQTGDGGEISRRSAMQE
jgi:biopolymer transport protein ExbD